MRLMLIFFVLMSMSAFADDEKSSIRLKVKPVLCITDQRTPACEMSFLIVWRSDAPGYYCLHNDIDESSLRCWAETQEGELNDERTVENPFEYWMSDDNDTLLAMVKVEVLRMESGDRRRSRRGRHVWDIL